MSVLPTSTGHVEQRPTLAAGPGTALTTAVDRLPELYQPIYGHPELSNAAARSCQSRLVHVRSTYAALADHLGRPLRVLDLGCAQGFFSCALAALGADVLGIDYCPENVAVCTLLGDEFPNSKLEFRVERLEDFIPLLSASAFDLVLGLSVFHHVVHERGQEATRALIDRLAASIGHGVFEIALPTEGVYWCASQPDDPRQMLGAFPFVFEAARVETHLSNQPRPLFVASRSIAVLAGAAYAFADHLVEPHALAENVHLGTRRYFLGPHAIVKVFRIDAAIAQINEEELSREAEFLAAFAGQLAFAPKLIAHGTNAAQAWLVREKIPGRLLMDLMNEGAVFDSLRVVSDVLRQADALERIGYFHADLRPWNVLVDDQGNASLIDFGSIGRTRSDVVWPEDVFLAFFLFLYELAQRRVARVLPVRAPFISPFNLPPPYREPALRMWQLPVSQWSFSKLREFWEGRSDAVVDNDGLATGIGLWQGAVERYLVKLTESHIASHQESARLGESAGTAANSASASQRSLETALEGLDHLTTRLSLQLDKVAVAQEAQGEDAAQTRRLIEASQSRALTAEHLDICFAAESARVASSMSQARIEARSELEGLRTSVVELARSQGHHVEHLSRLSDEVRAVAALLEPTGDSPSETPGSVAELMELFDERFVKGCFRLLLKRDADPDGLAHYLESVRDGTSRSAVVAAIALSREAAMIDSKPLDLDALLESERRARPGFLARVVARLAGGLWDPVTRRINALENALGAQRHSTRNRRA